MTKQMKLALGVAAGVVLLFCSSFVFFFTRMEKSASTAFMTSSKEGKPLPQANLIDTSGQPLADQSLRTGRVMLVFVSLECQATNTSITLPVLRLWSANGCPTRASELEG